MLRTHVRSRFGAGGQASVLILVLTVLTLPAASALTADDVPRVLVYSGTQAYRHASIAYGNPIIQALAEETGAFTVHRGPGRHHPQDPRQLRHRAVQQPQRHAHRIQ